MTATTHPLPALVAGSGALVALLGAPWLLMMPVMLVAYMALVVVTAGSRRAQRVQYVERVGRCRLPPMGQLSEPELCTIVTSLREARCLLGRIMRDSPDEIEALEDRLPVTKVEALEDHAGRLVHRVQRIHTHLSDLDMQVVGLPQELSARAARTQDARARYELARAGQIHSGRLEQQHALEGERDRLLGNLRRIEATLVALGPRLIGREGLELAESDLDEDCEVLLERLPDGLTVCERLGHLIASTPPEVLEATAIPLPVAGRAT